MKTLYGIIILKSDIDIFNNMWVENSMVLFNTKEKAKQHLQHLMKEELEELGEGFYIDGDEIYSTCSNDLVSSYIIKDFILEN